MKKIVILSLILIGATSSAQDFYAKIYNAAAQSLAGKALQKGFTADSLAQRRGLNPDDPELGVDFLVNGGVELRLEQTFDFPTVYANRTKLSRSGIFRAETELSQRVRELMLAISESYINALYNKELYELLESQRSSLDGYQKSIKQLVESGEMTVVNHYTAMDLYMSRAILAQNAKNDLENSLVILTRWGVQIEDSETPPNFAAIQRQNFFDRAKANDYNLVLARADSMIAARSLRLSRSEWMPKLKAGYRLNTEPAASPYSGIVTGISIPLWQNRNNVKHSKALIESSKAQKANVQKGVDVYLATIWNDYEYSNDVVETLVSTYSYKALSEDLNTLIKHRSITIADALLMLQQGFDLQLSLLEARRRATLARAVIEIITI